MQLNKQNAENKLREYGIDDMPIVPIQKTLTKLPSNWFTKYKETCHEFMGSLSDSIEDLVFMNLDQNSFIALLSNQILPNGLSIRFRTPLLYGGENSINNLFLCKTFPTSHKLDCFILDQADNDIIWVPNPVKKIYISAHTANGGTGGNATTDRLTQIAAQISASRDL